MALRILHVLMHSLEMSIFIHIVHFFRLNFVSVTLKVSYFFIRFLNTLFKATNLISLAFILCQLLGVKQSYPAVKCNIKKQIIYT